MSETLTRLQPGMLVRFGKEICRVVKVNDCCAKIVPVEKRTIVVRPWMGQPVTFQRSARGHNISPESELEILGGNT